MEQLISSRIAEITLKRERIKADLFDKQAKRLASKERFFLYGESTPFEDRIAMDSEIAHLEADRQRTKFEILQLKAQAKVVRESAFVRLLMDALEAHGLREEILKASDSADDVLKYEGLLEAYTCRF